MLTVLHASDLQCGRPFRPAAADALVRLAEQAKPDVVVVAGDLTQRAKDREFLTAMALIERMPPVPRIVTPGNHDVPLYRVWERVLTPYRNWRRRVSRDLNSVTRVPGATFVALNSSAPRRAIVNGRVDDFQLDFARRSFDTSAPGNIRALVIHHHFVPVPDGLGGKPLPRARTLAQAFESMEVDVVLGGHIHQTRFTTSEDVLGEASRFPVPFIACGTTTSRRGRGPEEEANSLNLVRIDDQRVEVVPHLMELGASSFEPSEPVVFPLRVGTGPRSGPSSGRRA